MAIHRMDTAFGDDGIQRNVPGLGFDSRYELELIRDADELGSPPAAVGAQVMKGAVAVKAAADPIWPAAPDELKTMLRLYLAERLG